MMPNISGFTGKVFGGYRLERLIDTGGNGAVFLGTQVDAPHEEAAVKILIPQLLDSAQIAEQRARFLREARTLSKQLRHERILPVLISGEDAATNVAYMVLPYMRNGTLAHRLSTAGQLPLADIARFITQIADALDYAHQQQVIHRDIKPSNILLDDKEQAVLADFGIAKLYDSDVTMHTSTDKTIGTAEYMSPEQAQGSTVGPASDIYSLGMLTYHLVTGQLPFPKSPAVATILVQTLTMPPASPTRYRPDLPLPAEVAILRALNKNPADRFLTARSFANAFSLGVQGAYSAEITNSPTSAFAVPATVYTVPVSGVTAAPVLQYQPANTPSGGFASPAPPAPQPSPAPSAILPPTMPTPPPVAQTAQAVTTPQPSTDKALAMPVPTVAEKQKAPPVLPVAATVRAVRRVHYPWMVRRLLYANILEAIGFIPLVLVTGAHIAGVQCTYYDPTYGCFSYGPPQGATTAAVLIGAVFWATAAILLLSMLVYALTTLWKQRRWAWFGTVLGLAIIGSVPLFYPYLGLWGFSLFGPTTPALQKPTGQSGKG